MMIRERINKIFASRVFYIIFSLLASLTIWLYVAYIENPDVNWNVRGIKVEYINKDYLTDRQLVITSINTDTVTIRFLGKRNTVSQLTSANLSVNVDLSEIKTTGVFQLPYDIIYPIDVNPASLTVTSRSVDYVTVTVDSLSKKEIPVKGTYDGGVAEGYKADPIELSPSTITVSGPQQVLASISYAWVMVQKENISKTYEENLPFVIMDVNGHEINSEQITFSEETIKVVIPVSMIKTIPLTVNLMYGAGADSTNTVSTITPSTITVAGDAETLDALNQILLGSIDLTNFINTTTVDLPVILPNDTTNLTGETQATVTVSIVGLDTLHISADNIQMTNVTAGYTATIVTKSLDIVLRGKPEEIDKVASSNIRIVADLSELGATTGTYSVLAKVYVDGDLTSVGPIGDYKVTVALAKD